MNYKVSSDELPQPGVIDADAMLIGQIGKYPICGPDSWLLRHYGGWVRLDAPQATWANSRGPGGKVRLLMRGEKITLIGE